MSYDVFSALLLFAFVSSITPGPNNIMLLASGVNFGFRRTIPHMLGIGAGFVALLLAVGLGLGAVLTAFPALHTALKIAGGAYLLYLSWVTARSALRPLSTLCQPPVMGRRLRLREPLGPPGSSPAHGRPGPSPSMPRTPRSFATPSPRRGAGPGLSRSPVLEIPS